MIVADTSAILATADTSSSHHDRCADFVRRTDHPMFVSHMVVAEVDYLLTSRFGVAAANQFLTDVASGAYLLAPTDEQDLRDAAALNARYADQALGVTDCLNILLADRFSTTRIFTLDERHFRAVRPLAHGPCFEIIPVDLPEA